MKLIQKKNIGLEWKKKCQGQNRQIKEQGLLTPIDLVQPNEPC